MPTGDGTRVDVLGPVLVQVGGAPVSLDGMPMLTHLLALLALGPERGVQAKVLAGELWRGKPTSGSATKLQQLVSRLRGYGLRDQLPPQQDGCYRLALGPDRVDARRLIATARVLQAGGTVADDELDDVLALWRGDPGAGSPLAPAHANPVRDARSRLLAERSRRTRPRLLIVDDKVGHRIGSILGDYRCTVLRRVEDFWPLEPSCERLFDAALVDLHLTAGDAGAEGLAVLDALRRSAVPAVLMTFRPQPGRPDAVVQRYNLLGFYIKSSNSEDGDFSGLRELVDELVGQDAEAVLLRRLDEDLVRRERKAAKLLELQGEGPVARAQMRTAVDDIRAIIRNDGPLSSARRAMAEFSEKWLPGER